MKILINLKIITLMLCIVAFFPPAFLDFTSYGKYLDYLFIGIKLAVTAWYGIVYLVYRKKHFFDFWIAFFLTSQIVSANQTATLTIGYVVGQIFSFAFYLLVKINLEDSPEQLLKSLFYIFMSYLVFQVTTQIHYVNGFDPKHPYGDNRAYFLGRKNNATPYLLYVFVCFYLLNNKMTKIVSVKEMAFLVFVFIISVLTRSSTTLICLTVAILIRFLGTSEKVENIYTKSVAGIYIFLNSVILSSENQLISGLMGTIFGKSSFSGRTEIWQLAIKYFKENFWFGYGLDISFVPWTNGAIVYSAHNTLLDILARYGAITGGILLILLMSQVLFRTCLKYRTLLVLFISFLMYALMENSPTIMMILIISTTYYLNLKMGESDAKIY
ncbi:O-antigen ligase family protein [Streptococcus sp. S784/96/1]|uniref:O-antigen ligase family protein n=1 Tax=Streptococcus sp. S784/96/1 TaxID=2653499 RepID=UPI001386C9E8|nr:O-antigen ligase family protein [Streptococcus sp. S784/96/1]